MGVAERLTDEEFQHTKEWFEKHVANLPIKFSYYKAEGYAEPDASTDLWDGPGAFAAKLSQFGFIRHSIRVVVSNDMLGNPKEPLLAADMLYDVAYAELVALIDLAVTRDKQL